MVDEHDKRTVGNTSPRVNLVRVAACSAGVIAALLLPACQRNGGSSNATAMQSSASADNDASTSNGTAFDLGLAQGTGGAGSPGAQQQQWLAQATAFIRRPEQQRDLDTAMRARASTHPAFCPSATFAPKRIDIAFDPAPAFAADGTMTRGDIVYRATMQGCSIPLLLTVSVEAAPGMPLRFRAGVPGTTFADVDLQERAVPQAVAAARPLVPGCGQVMPVDTRLIGASQRNSATLVPWSEYWLVSGCGRLVSVKLDFTPDRVANQTTVRADPAGSRLLQAGAAGTAPATPVGGGTMAPSGGGKVVATATGSSVIPLGGGDIPGAKVAGTCLMKLREAASAPPDHAECTTGLPMRPGAAIACSASRGQAQGRMDVAIAGIDRSAGSATFQCVVRAP